MALRLLITGMRFTPCRRNIRTVIRSATTDMAIQVTPPGMPRWGSTGITRVDGARGDIDAHPLRRLNVKAAKEIAPEIPMTMLTRAE